MTISKDHKWNHLANMNLRMTFLVMCASTVCIILILTLKKTISKEAEKESKWSNSFDSVERNVSLNMKLLVEPECESSSIIWIVTSSAEEPLARTALRQAYPSEELKDLGIRRIFLLGVPAKEDVHKLISEESKKHNDVLQGDFVEAYRNLTLKHLMGLEWSVKKCTARFLIKTDDDIVLDIYAVIKLLDEGIITENEVSGYVLKNMFPVRTRGNKWFVDETEFSGKVYPDFVSGWFYMAGLRIVENFVERSKVSDEFFWIDDVYITGILRDECGIKIKELNRLYTTDYRYLECCIRGKKKFLKCEFMAGPDGGKRELQMEFKDFSAFCRQNCVERTKEQSIARTCVAVYENNLEVKNSKVQIYSI